MTTTQIFPAVLKGGIQFPKDVRLKQPEIFTLAFNGICRCYDAKVKELRGETHGSDEGTSWQRHIEGKLAEGAWAKVFNFYSLYGEIFEVDFPPDIEIRQTNYATGHLVVHPNDKEYRWYFLVTGSFGVYTIQGFMLGIECMRRDWWGKPSAKGAETDKTKKEDRPCFNGPQSHLHRHTDESEELISRYKAGEFPPAYKPPASEIHYSDRVKTPVVQDQNLIFEQLSPIKKNHQP